MPAPVRLAFQRLSTRQPPLPLPAYATAGSSGMDLMADVDDDVTIAPGARARVPTGFAVAVPEGQELQVRPRSGLAAKAGVTVLNTPGTVDQDYRGEVAVILINLGESPFVIHRADRIAQAVLCPVTRAAPVEVDSLDDTGRGAGGFGSTGQ